MVGSVDGGPRLPAAVRPGVRPRPRSRIRRKSVLLMVTLLLVGVVLVIGHELGHILTAMVCGGRFQGLVFRGFAVGVALDVTALSPAQRLATAWAGVVAETGLLALLALGAQLTWWTWTVPFWALLLLAANAFLNLGPWWAHNDGARVRAWRRMLRLSSSL